MKETASPAFRAWAARQAAAARRQLLDLDLKPAGSDWRQRASNARTRALLLAREARFSRLAVQPDDEQLPF